MASFSQYLNGVGRALVGQSPRGNMDDIHHPFHSEITRETFIKLKLTGLYRRIINSCIKRTIWPEFDEEKRAEIERSFYDCFENSSNNSGLVSFIASAMFDRKERVLVFNQGILREATNSEKRKIQDEYARVTKSSIGVIIDFKNFGMTEILRHYYYQMFELNSARTIALNVAGALNIGIDKLREMISKQNSAGAVQQAQDMAAALKKGNAVLSDSGDKIGPVGGVDVKPQLVARDSIYSEISEQTGLPVSFISGEPTTGASILGDMDINREADAIEEYWLSIWEPITKNLYGIEGSKYRREKWRALESKARSVAIVESLDTMTGDEKREFAVEVLELKNDAKTPAKES